MITATCWFSNQKKAVAQEFMERGQAAVGLVGDQTQNGPESVGIPGRF
jgi:hypothetical protein